MPRRHMTDVLVLLPGIGGSVLQKDGRDVWAVSGGAVWQALRTLGRSIQDLALEEDPPDEDDLGDGITAPRIMPDIHIIPGLAKIDGYSGIAARFREVFEFEPGQNFFEFAYDWRRDCRVAARRLARQSHDWLAGWRDRTNNPDARLILVGHSMGGLVARHFLELLDGWRDTRMLITFGTPYGGSLNAFDVLAHGMKKKLGPITVADLSALLRSFTTVYQLLPIYPCIDAGDGQMLRVLEGEPIPNLDPDRARAALDFHHHIRDAVEKHRQEDDYRDHGYRAHPIVGTFQPTSLSARRTAGGGVEILRHYPGEDQDGDGTVPAVSAIPYELANQQAEVFVADRHASLQNAREVFVQLHGLLSGLGVDQSKYFALDTVHVSLDVEDAYAADEQVTFQVRSDAEKVDLELVVVDAEREAVVHRSALTAGAEEWQPAQAGPLVPGTYRVTVTGGHQVEPVTDVFVVAGQE
jgi:pimeloyl-ACP methyl ester carboxylesterase